MYRLHGSEHIRRIVRAAAQRQQLVLEGLRGLQADASTFRYTSAALHRVRGRTAQAARLGRTVVWWGQQGG